MLRFSLPQLWLHEATYGPSAPQGSSQAEAFTKVCEFAEKHKLRVPKAEV